MAEPSESSGVDAVVHSQALSERSPVATALIAERGHVVEYANPAFCDLVGERPDAVLGRPLGEVLYCSSAETLSELLGFAHREGKAVSATLEHRLPNRGTVWLGHTAWPVLGPVLGKEQNSTTEEPSWLLVQIAEHPDPSCGRDVDAITIDELLEANQRLVLAGVREQSLAEEAEKRAARLDALIAEHDRIGRALRAERDRAQEYLDLARTLLVTVDTTGTVTQINRRGCEVLGYSSEEVVGASWFDKFVPAQARDAARAIFASLLADGPGAAEHSESQILCRSGEERLISWHRAAIRDPEGRVCAVGCSGEDVTEERRSAELRTSFLRLASHELRSPVSALTACVHLLNRRGGRDARENELYELLEDTSQRMVQLVRTLLDLAELQMGKQLPSKSVLDLGRLAREQTERARSRAPAHRFAAHRRGNEPLLVSADGRMIGQVMEQLLDNAAKYSPSGSLIEVTATSRGGDVLVSVRDQGIGIARGDQARLSEPFYQVSPMIYPTRGFGLGLFLVVQILRLHGGRIWLESNPGEGSTFSFSLPRAEAATAEPGTPAS